MYERRPVMYEMELDQYERDNLLWLLEVARKIGLDTGDWLHQIVGWLRPDEGAGTPNADPADTDLRLRLFVERFEEPK